MNAQDSLPAQQAKKGGAKPKPRAPRSKLSKPAPAPAPAAESRPSFLPSTRVSARF